MKKHIYSLTAVLLAGVFLLSCATEDPLIQPIKAGYYTTNYDAALAAADSALEVQPDNPVVYYYRGATLGKIAENNPDVEARKSTYEEMRSNLVQARELFAAQEDPAAEAENVTPTILNTWRLEHNSGVQYATDDSLMNITENPLDRSIAHLHNAIVINPDSTLSYDVLGSVYYMNQEPAKAADAIAKVIELTEKPDADIYDRVSSYYFVSEQPDKAVAAIKEGLELYPDSINLVQKLADGLFQTGEVDEALSIMNQLIDSDPNNAIYRLVVGTRIYQRVLQLNDQLATNKDAIFDLEQNDGPQSEIDVLKEENETLTAEIEKLTDRAETALLKAVELDDSNPSTYNTLGILYQNKSAALFELRNETVDDDKAAEYDEMAREEARTAMKYYEKAAELDPDNTNYWTSLFRIYTLLDMREEAEDAMEKAGM